MPVKETIVQMERRKTDLILKWLEAHETSDKQMHEAYQKSLDLAVESVKGLREDLKPILQVYNTTTTNGRWLMKLVLFISACVAIVAGILKVKTGQ